MFGLFLEHHEFQHYRCEGSDYPLRSIPTMKSVIITSTRPSHEQHGLHELYFYLRTLVIIYYGYISPCTSPK